jgi:hypothetical protein
MMDERFGLSGANGVGHRAKFVARFGWERM